jgi:hypothetical protein
MVLASVMIMKHIRLIFKSAPDVDNECRISIKNSVGDLRHMSIECYD